LNGLLGGLCAVIVVVQAPPRWRRATVRWGAAILPLAAYATLYGVWPRLWRHPVAALVAALEKLDIVHGSEPFLGAVTRDPPAYYFGIYLLATLPIVVLLGAVLGAVRLVRVRDRGALIVACWFAIPLAVAASPIRQDGVRYVLPCVLALAMIAAAGFDQLATWMRVRHAAPAIGALVVYLGATLWRCHPYYLDYFGEQVGGAGAVWARGWFETAWWGEGLDVAVGYINEHAAPGARVDRRCVHPAHLGWYREDLWAAMTDVASEADWIVDYAPPSQHCPIPPDARRVFEVTTDGAVLATVYQRP
jgi:hypothetical protein